MSKAWSVNRPGNGVTQLDTSPNCRDNVHDAEKMPKADVRSGTVVRLSPVQKEFWENFQSRRGHPANCTGTTIVAGSFTQILASDPGIKTPTKESTNTSMASGKPMATDKISAFKLQRLASKS
ncbi:MAG: hypothetical protein V4695_06710 [Pseudomonadota bacterium]